MNFFSILLLLSSVSCASLLDCFKYLVPENAADIVPEQHGSFQDHSNTKFYDVEVEISIESENLESISPEHLKWIIKKYTDKAIADARNIIRSRPELLDRLQDDEESHVEYDHNDIKINITESDDHKASN